MIGYTSPRVPIRCWNLKNYPDSKSSMTYRDIKSPIYLTGEASMKNEDLDVAVKDVWTNC